MNGLRLHRLLDAVILGVSVPGGGGGFVRQVDAYGFNGS